MIVDLRIPPFCMEEKKSDMIANTQCQVLPCSTEHVVFDHAHTRRQTHSAQIGMFGTPLWLCSQLVNESKAEKASRYSQIPVSERRAEHVTNRIYMSAMLGHTRTGCIDPAFLARPEKRPRLPISNGMLPNYISQASTACVLQSFCTVLIAAFLHKKLELFLCELFLLLVRLLQSTCDSGAMLFHLP